MPLFIGQELYHLGDALHGITVKTEDPYDVDEVKAQIEKFLVPVVDTHSHAYAETSQAIADWIALMDRIGGNRSLG